MGWSTSQLADLAGTTVRAVRHYHEVGLLAEPERRANGYKSYGVPHLVRVLRIGRLTGLGLSLAQVADLGEADVHPGDALRRLDTELAETIERLRRARAELALILERGAPTDLPPDIAAAITDVDLSPQERSFTVVLAQLISPEALSAYAEVLAGWPKEPVEVEFDALPGDADEQTRQRIAEHLLALPATKEMRARFPDTAAMCVGGPHGEEFAKRTIAKVVAELFNAAQIDVMVRMNA